MIEPLDTKELLKSIEEIHAILLLKATECNSNKVSEQVKKDLAGIDFQRGYLMGVIAVLRCSGIPRFLSGKGAERLDISLGVLIEELQVEQMAETLKTQINRMGMSA